MGDPLQLRTFQGTPADPGLVRNDKHRLPMGSEAAEGLKGTWQESEFPPAPHVPVSWAGVDDAVPVQEDRSLSNFLGRHIGFPISLPTLENKQTHRVRQK